ncbi:MAG: signal peptidase II, partial [Rhodothermia bacterium]
MESNSTSPMREFLKSVLPTMLAVITLDLAAKFIVNSMMQVHDPLPVIGNVFRLHLTYNEGVAFGLLASQGSWVIVVNILAMLGLAIWGFRTLTATQSATIPKVALAILLGAALSNLVDRIYDGRVTDFLDLGIGAYRWPIFNLADVFILVSVALLLWSSYKAETQSET